MIFAHVERVTPPTGGFAVSPAPSSRRDPGSGPRNTLGPKTTVTVNAWAMLGVVGSVFLFAVSVTWAASGKLHDVEEKTKDNTTRINRLEHDVATREDLERGNAATLRAMQRMLGAAVIQCDKFGGDSKCMILFPAGAGQ